MSFSSDSSRPALTLPRQDTATTMSSFSSSLSNFDTTESLSNTSSLRRPKQKAKIFAAFGDEKTLRTLKLHYYPEGHWGWLILCFGVVVHTINHGLHMSHGMLLLKLMDTFGSNIDAGDYNL